MVFSSSVNNYFAPTYHGKQSDESTPTKRSGDEAVSDLKHHIQINSLVSRKSIKAEKERKTFKQEAEALGYKFNKNFDKYQAIHDSKKLISIAEMESLVGSPHQDLLPELFEHILSFLPHKDWAAVKSVSKLWDRKVLSTIKNKKEALLKLCGKFLDQNMSDRELAKKISYIISESRIFDSKNEMDVRSMFLDLQEKILLVLTKINFEDLKKLEKKAWKDQEVPRFFKYRIYMAATYAKVSLEKDEWVVSSILKKLARELLKVGMLEDSFKVASSIKKVDREAVLSEIAMEWMSLQHFDRALEVAYAMRPSGALYNNHKNTTLRAYSNQMIQSCMNDFKMAKMSLENLCEACNLLKKNSYWMSSESTTMYRKEVFSLLIGMDQADLARMLANAITDLGNKEAALKTIDDLHLLGDKSLLTSNFNRIYLSRL